MRERMFSGKTVQTLTLTMLTMLLVVFTSKAQETQDTLRLTLDQALEIALSENLTVKIADQEITKTEYAKKGTYASLYPQIDMSGSYQHSIKIQKVSMGGQEFEMGTKNVMQGGVSASMPIVSVPLWKSLKLSAYDVELAVEKARSSRVDMIDQVKRAYYAVLLAEEATVVYKEAYDNAVKNYNDINAKYEKGLAAEYDAIRADVNVKNAEPSLYNAENSLILANWQLKVLIGIDLQNNVKCMEKLSEYEERILSDYINTDPSLDNNSALNQLDVQFKQLQKSREIQKAGFLPSLSGEISYNLTAMSPNLKINHYRWNPSSTVGLGLSIPIFQGGKRRLDIKQTDISLKQLEEQRVDLERNLRLAVKQSTDQMSTSIKQYQAARAGVAASEKGYNITMKRYETGEGTMLDINDSQLSLTQARLNLNQSIYDYLVAKSSLEKTLGNTNE